jgi:hypothetical protein
MLFVKKKAIQIALVDKPKNEEIGSEEIKILHPDTLKLIAVHGKEVVKFIGIAGISFYAAVKAIDTASQVIIKKTKSADQED